MAAGVLSGCKFKPKLLHISASYTNPLSGRHRSLDFSCPAQKESRSLRSGFRVNSRIWGEGWLICLEQFATQYAGKAEDPGTKQHDAARLRSAPAADRECFARNRAYGAFRGHGRAARATAAFAAVLIPEDRIAAGDGRVLQVEPVAGAASGSYIQAGHCDRVNVVAILVGGNECVSDVLAAGRTGANDRSTVLRGGNGPVYRAHCVA